jgi:hypothetical protein
MHVTAERYFIYGQSLLRVFIIRYGYRLVEDYALPPQTIDRGEIEAIALRLYAEEATRPDVARKRRWWKKIQARIAAARLVFIDETWVKTNMAPLRGWCRKGLRLKARAPHGHWKTLTFVSALRVNCVTAPCVFDGPINGECFSSMSNRFWCPA